MKPKPKKKKMRVSRERDQERREERKRWWSKDDHEIWSYNNEGKEEKNTDDGDREIKGRERVRERDGAMIGSFDRLVITNCGALSGARSHAARKCKPIEGLKERDGERARKKDEDDHLIYQIWSPSFFEGAFVRDETHTNQNGDPNRSSFFLSPLSRSHNKKKRLPFFFLWVSPSIHAKDREPSLWFV